MINSNCSAQLHLKWYTVGINQFWIKLSVSLPTYSIKIFSFPNPKRVYERLIVFSSKKRQGTLDDCVLEIRKKKLRLTPQKKSAPHSSCGGPAFLKCSWSVQFFWTVHEHFKNKYKNNKKYLDIPMKFEQHLNVHEQFMNWFKKHKNLTWIPWFAGCFQFTRIKGVFFI